MSAPDPGGVAGSPTSPIEQIHREAAEWRAIVSEVLGSHAELVSVSRYVADSRVYRSDDRIAKIRRLDRSWPADAGMAVEARILDALGRDVDYRELDGWEISIQSVLPGAPFSSHLFDQQDNAFGMRDRWRVLAKLAPELRKLHRAGISHGDLRADNLLVEGDDIHLVDFDRAATGSRIKVAYRDWIGIGGGRLSSPTPFWKLAASSLVPKSQTLARRLRHRFTSADRGPTADVPADVAALNKAWRLAEESPANARDQGLAYYALSYRGHHLPGERAWPLRWEAIAKSVDFTGKRVLELGCNMGLLSNYARAHGATAALGVDHDQKVVDAARLLASAWNTGASFERVDLTADDDWEARLAGSDLVTALSVVHWLPNQDRVLKFLATHSELLYEGHASLSAEIDLLRSLGFEHVDVVMRTERDRHVLYGRRAGGR